MYTDNHNMKNNTINASKRFRQNPGGGSPLVKKSRKNIMEIISFDFRIKQYRISTVVTGGSIDIDPGSSISKSRPHSEKSKWAGLAKAKDVCRQVWREQHFRTHGGDLKHWDRELLFSFLGSGEPLKIL